MPHKNYKKKVVVFGFGAQGSAQSQNLVDSGWDVCVFLRPNSGRIPQAKKAKIPIITDIKKAAKMAEIAVMLTPDGEQSKLWKKIEPFLPKNSTVIFAHGFNIHYKQIVPKTHFDVILVAPMAQGVAVRKDFVSGKGVPCLIAVAQDATGNAKKTAFKYAKAIGGKGPFIKTTFREETETDLFAEQAVLCGGLFALIRAGFDTLISSGYNKKMAYFCCLKEIRALANLVHEHGISGAREHISDVALYGDVTRGHRIINAGVKREMKKLLSEIRKGYFTKEFITDKCRGGFLLQKLLKKDNRHPIERVFKRA